MRILVMSVSIPEILNRALHKILRKYPVRIANCKVREPFALQASQRIINVARFPTRRFRWPPDHPHLVQPLEGSLFVELRIIPRTRRYACRCLQCQSIYLHSPFF